jgi:predicted nucleic acid-binding protein
MVLVDSFGWIEYLAGGKLAERYEEYLAILAEVVTPTIVLYEVYRKLRRERKEEEALLVTGQIMKTRVVPLDEEISLLAAEVSLKHALPTADAIVYATAMKEACAAATSGPHFQGLEDVIYLQA